VVITIRYSEGLRPFFLTTVKKIKENHPHVVLEKQILPSVKDSNNDMVFEVLVDGKVCVGKRRMKKQTVRTSSSNNSNDNSGGSLVLQQQPPGHDVAGGRSVYVSMDELEIAISKARKRRRPSTYYGRMLSSGDNRSAAAMRLDMLRKHNLEKGHGYDGWAD